MFASHRPIQARGLRVVIALGLATSTAVAADQESIARIVVTATRAPADLASVGDSITVLSAEQTRESQKTTVADLLSMTPGVGVSRNGGLGGTTSLRIRGAETDHTVVLINGVKLNDPASVGGAFDFANLLIDDVSRIEVLRGAQSTLWGSQAIGGVVNIVTPEPSGPLTTTLDVQGGSLGTLQAMARAQAGSERFGWRVGVGYLTTDGISAFAADRGGREDDGYRNRGVSAQGVWQLVDGVRLEARTTWSSAHAEFDGFPPPVYSFADTPEYGTTDEWVSYAGVRIDSFGNRLQHRIGVAHTDTDRKSTDPASSVPTTLDAQGTNVRYEYQGTLTLNERISGVFGIERERSALTTSAPTTFEPNPIPLDRDVVLDSIYAQVQIAPLRGLTLTGGLRYDDHETFGDNTSAQLAAAWSVTTATLLRASYGGGFKAPTLYQLYSQYGTPTLDPEDARDWDVGVEQRLFKDRLVVSATYFEREIDNMIDFVSCYGGAIAPNCAAQPEGYYQNLARTRADGYELALTGQLAERLSFTANYTGLDARVDTRASANFGNELARRPRDAAAAALTYAWRIPLTTTLAAQYVGRSFDDVANRTVLRAYTLVDLRASYRWSDRIELYGRIENVLDEAYETVSRYGTLGRTAYIGVRVTP